LEIGAVGDASVKQRGSGDGSTRHRYLDLGELTGRPSYYGVTAMHMAAVVQMTVIDIEFAD
jgi:hypothetical protein